MTILTTRVRILLKIELLERGKKPVLRNPVLVCGLPGSAFVGKFAVDHLISELPGTLLAEIYSDSFPPQVIVKETGEVSLIKNELYFWKNSDRNGNDLIILTGDAQPLTPESEYSLSEYIVDYSSRELGAKQLITLGAYVTGAFTESPKVYGATTDVTLASRIKDLGGNLMLEGGITGMNGLLLGMAKLKRMDGYTLLGETSGYVFDPKASECVLNLLGKIVRFEIDMKKLEARAREAQEALREGERLRSQEEERQGRGETEGRKRLDYIS